MPMTVAGEPLLILSRIGITAFEASIHLETAGK